MFKKGEDNNKIKKRSSEKKSFSYFHLDTLRLIKKTLNRFISLFLIVFIGVAFMAGLMATPDIMRESVDVYFDEYELMDVQLYSSYGFCNEDLEVMKDVDGIKKIEGSHFTDVYGFDSHSNFYVTRLQELESSINQFELVDGRMPKNKNEALCLKTSSFGAVYKVGDTVTFEKDDLEDFVSEKQVKIVGLVKTPQYMSSSKEPSTLDNKDLEAVLYVDNDILISEYYTTIYIQLEDMVDEIAFTKAYDNLVEAKIRPIKSKASKQEAYLKDTLIEDAYQEIADGEKELEEKLAEANLEIADAEKELEDAHIQLIVGESQIESNKKQIEFGEKEIASNEKLLNDNAKEVDDAIALIEDESGSDFDTVYAEVSGMYSTYITLKNQKGQTNETVEAAKTEKARVEELIASNDQLISEKEAYIATLDPSIPEQNEEIIKTNQEIADLKEQNDLYYQEIESLDLIIDEYNDDNIQEILDNMDNAMNGSVEDTYYQMTLLKDAKEKIEDGRRELDAAKRELEMSKDAIKDAEEEIAEGKVKLKDGEKELDEAKKTLNDEVEKALNDINKAKQDIEELPEASWTILDRDSHYSTYMFENTINQMAAICKTVPFMFYLVAALVCMTTMTRLIDEQRAQIGIFSALGFSKNKIISKYLIYALIATLSASIIAVPFGILIFPRVIYETWRLMYDLPPMLFIIPILPTLFCLSAFTLLMLVVTYYVAHNSLNEVPSQLMRPKAPKTAKKVFLEHIPFIWKHLSFTSKITARNLIRYKTRFFMTVIGVAGCTGLLVLGYGIKDCIGDIIQIQFTEVFDYTNTINLENDHKLDDIVYTLESDYNNEEIVPFESYTTKVYLEEDDKTIQVQIFDARDIRNVINLRERRSGDELRIEDEGVVISEKFAKSNNIKVGDVITIESEAGIKGDVEVLGIAEIYFQHYLFMSFETYENVFNENVHCNSIAVKSKNSSDLVNKMKDYDTVVSIVDFGPMISNFTTMIEALDIIIAVIILAAGSLALVVLMNLTQVNISERIREIATLKVLGFRPKEVNSYIFKEIFLLSIIGGLVGLPLGKLAHIYIMSIIDMDMVMFGTKISIFSYGISFAITMFFTALVLTAMRKPLNNIEMVESLKSVE